MKREVAALAAVCALTGCGGSQHGGTATSAQPTSSLDPALAAVARFAALDRATDPAMYSYVLSQLAGLCPESPDDLVDDVSAAQVIEARHGVNETALHIGQSLVTLASADGPPGCQRLLVAYTNAKDGTD